MRPGYSPAHVAQRHEFPTLREALGAAAQSKDAEGAQPWIITEDGDILCRAELRPRPTRPDCNDRP